MLQNGNEWFCFIYFSDFDVCRVGTDLYVVEQFRHDQKKMYVTFSLTRCSLLREKMDLYESSRAIANHFSKLSFSFGDSPNYELDAKYVLKKKKVSPSSWFRIYNTIEQCRLFQSSLTRITPFFDLTFDHHEHFVTIKCQRVFCTLHEFVVFIKFRFPKDFQKRKIESCITSQYFDLEKQMKHASLEIIDGNTMNLLITFKSNSKLDNCSHWTLDEWLQSCWLMWSDIDGILISNYDVKYAENDDDNLAPRKRAKVYGRFSIEDALYSCFNVASKKKRHIETRKNSFVGPGIFTLAVLIGNGNKIPEIKAQWNGLLVSDLITPFGSDTDIDTNITTNAVAEMIDRDDSMLQCPEQLSVLQETNFLPDPPDPLTDYESELVVDLHLDDSQQDHSPVESPPYQALYEIDAN